MMNLKNLKTIGMIGLGAFTLHKIGFFKDDFFLWNMGKSQQITQSATEGIKEGAKESTQEAIQSATRTLDTGARMFIPPYAWIRSAQDLRDYLSDRFTKTETEPILSDEERRVLIPRVSDIPNNTQSAIRHIQEATGEYENITKERRQDFEILPVENPSNLRGRFQSSNLIFK